MLHAKAFVRDDEDVLVGTCNLEAWSLRRFFEIDVLVRSAELAEQFEERFTTPAIAVSSPGGRSAERGSVSEPASSPRSHRCSRSADGPRSRDGRNPFRGIPCDACRGKQTNTTSLIGAWSMDGAHGDLDGFQSVLDINALVAERSAAPDEAPAPASRAAAAADEARGRGRLASAPGRAARLADAGTVGTGGLEPARGTRVPGDGRQVAEAPRPDHRARARVAARDRDVHRRRGGQPRLLQRGRRGDPRAGRSPRPGRCPQTGWTSQFLLEDARRFARCRSSACPRASRSWSGDPRTASSG